jgi:hypothetical protein
LRHSSAVKRHCLLGVAQNLSRVNWNITGEGGGTNQQVAVLTGLKGFFARARERFGSVGTSALATQAGAIPLAFKISLT